MKCSNLLFDLDGTLTDPAEGIINSIQYALKSLNVRLPTPNELRWCIGPPLQETFLKLLPSEKSNKAADALKLYREYFSEKGMFENKAYLDIQKVLENLNENKFNLFVATSKPHVYATKILEHFNLRNYFLHIYGSELDGTNRDKSDLIRHILSNENLDKDETIMIGDRKHDLIGANNNQINCIGVTYGYGSIDELSKHNPLFLATTPTSLEEFIIKNYR